MPDSPVPDRSLAVTTDLDVSPQRVAGVLGDRDVWVRAAVALGLQVDAHPSTTGSVTDGDLLRLRRRARRGRARPARRALILQARRPDPSVPPAWTVLAGPGPVTALGVELAAGTDRSTRATIHWTVRSAHRRRAPWWSDRSLTAAGRLLLGIADVTARAPRVVVAAAIVRPAGERTELLLGRVPSGEWELPGGKVEPRESEHEALRREIAEELGVQVTPERRVGRPVDLGDGRELRCLTATVDAGQPPPRATEHTELRWIGVDELAGVALRPADEAWRDDLRRLLGAPWPDPPASP